MPRDSFRGSCGKARETLIRVSEQKESCRKASCSKVFRTGLSQTPRSYCGQTPWGAKSNQNLPPREGQSSCFLQSSWSVDYLSQPPQPAKNRPTEGGQLTSESQKTWAVFPGPLCHLGWWRRAWPLVMVSAAMLILSSLQGSAALPLTVTQATGCNKGPNASPLQHLFLIQW